MIDEGGGIIRANTANLISYHISVVPKSCHADINKQDTLVLIELDYLDSSAMQLKRKRNAAEACVSLLTVLFTGDWVSVVAC